MKRKYPRIVMAVLVMAGLQLSACSDSQPKPMKIEPALVERIAGSEIRRVTLTPKAMERLDIQTTPVLGVNGAGMQNSDGETVAFTPGSAIFAGSSPGTVTGSDLQTFVPYAAVIYDAPGDAWVYTSPKPRTFVRYPIVVDYIKGDQAILLDGPPIGTQVAIVGVAELYGTESEVGH